MSTFSRYYDVAPVHIVVGGRAGTVSLYKTKFPLSKQARERYEEAEK